MSASSPLPPAIVVMGVSGAGKTTLGRALAARIGYTFIEGDALHPAANVAKMATDAMCPIDDQLATLLGCRQRRGASDRPCSRLARALRRAVAALPGVPA